MTQSPTTVLGAAIAAPIEQFMAAFSRGDAAGAAAVYTADAQVLPQQRCHHWPAGDPDILAEGHGHGRQGSQAGNRRSGRGRAYCL